MFQYLKKIILSFQNEPHDDFAFQKFHYFIIMLTLFVVFYARFFTETIPLFPRIFQTLDVALFLLQTLLIFLRMRVVYQNILIKLGFILIILFASVILNLNSVFMPAVFSFWVFLFQPIVFLLFILQSRLSKYQQYRLLSFISITFIVQLIVGSIQIPQAMSISPDRLSGTFGFNSVQMLFFLCTISFILFVMYLKKESKLFIWLSPIIITLFFMASARMIWLIYVLLILIIFLKETGKSRHFRVSVLITVLMLGFFIYNFFNIIAIEKENFLSAFSRDLDVKKLGIYKGVKAWVELVSDHPIALFLGTGPGSFSSRAFMTFGMNWQSQANVTATMITSAYYSPYAVKYVIPKFDVYLGSATVAQPTSSYTSYLAEMGLIATIFYFSIYIYFYKELNKIYKETKVPLIASLSLGSRYAILLLGYMALFGDWFGVSRVTLFLWTIIAIVIMLYNLELFNKENFPKEMPNSMLLSRNRNFPALISN